MKNMLKRMEGVDKGEKTCYNISEAMFFVKSCKFCQGMDLARKVDKSAYPAERTKK